MSWSNRSSLLDVGLVRTIDGRVPRASLSRSQSMTNPALSLVTSWTPGQMTSHNDLPPAADEGRDYLVADGDVVTIKV